MKPLIVGDKVGRMKNTLQAAWYALGSMFHAEIITGTYSLLATSQGAKKRILHVRIEKKGG